MDLENIRLREVNQTKTKVLGDISHMWNLKNNTKDLYTQQKQTLIHREQTYRYQKKKGGENYEFGIKRYTLLIQKR